MALTGPWTLLLVVVLCVAAPAAAILLWQRPATTPMRWTVRGGMLLATQLTAVALVAVLVNDSFGFYTSWRELLGESHKVTELPASAGTQDPVIHQQTVRGSRTGEGSLVKIIVPGTASGLRSFPAFVYLPPQYGDPAYAERAFPVVELLDGYPGTPQTWTSSLAVTHILDREITSGRVVPLIAVMPTQNVAMPRDTECVNVVGGPQVETYLTTDVRAAVQQAFRAQQTANSWALMGYSTGGFCAVNLAMRNPTLYASGVSMSGYAKPAHDHTTGELFGRNRQLQDENTPLWRAQHLPPPPVGLLLMTSRQDPESMRDDDALAAAAQAPFEVDELVLSHGGHNFTVWQAMEPTAFGWLSHRLPAPLAPVPTIDHRGPGSTVR